MSGSCQPISTDLHISQEEIQVLLTEEEALQIVLPQAERVVAARIDLEPEVREAVERRLCRRIESRHDLYVGLRNGGACGYALVAEEIGKYLPITFMVGVDPQGTVSDVAVMIHREKIGADCAKRRYLNQFRGKSTRDPCRRNRDLVHVSGATLSCDGVAAGVRKALAVVQEYCIARPANVRRMVQEADKPIIQERYVMGTLCRITAFGTDAKVVNAAFEEIKRWDALLSDYKDDSELSRLNARAAEEAVTVSPDTLAFLEECRKWHDATRGAFDPTVGALMKLWGFRGGAPAEPSAEELKKALEAVGMRHVLREEDRVRFARAGVALDPGGIGKGWALDKAAEVLRQAGVRAAALDFGSTFLAIGAPPGEKGWPVEVRDPFDPKRILGRLRIKDASVSTSGNYEHFVEIDGRKVGHMMDPRTGRPAEGVASATVMAPTATESEVWTKPLFVFGPEAGLKLLEKAGREAAVIPVDPNAPRAETPGWTKLFKKKP
ncbi:MAG: FAD:protein FMN transferase [Planctomycetes bacterium]|nr:FAD:protein FMN transferase [Planctomycetota bacterium]